MKKMMLLFCLCSILWAKDDLNILSDWITFSDTQNALYHYMSQQAFDYLDERQKAIDSLSTREEWTGRQKDVREKLDVIFGEWPQKTPLKAKVTGKIKTPDYMIEKIVFQSQPEFYVTAACIVPNELRGKAPAVIYCAGHTSLGWRSPTYQKIVFNLAAKGFIVLAFDPIGQGERLQYFDPDSLISKIGGPTLEHSYVAAQCFLNGSSVAKIMTWDGIRAVDYLLSRRDVDPERIGITGRSGGGTQTTFIAAMDERIYAAAPECYITRWQRLLQTKGPQDGEQNLYHFIANGLDFPDLLSVRAPKPTLQISTTRDFFSIQGSMETAAEVECIYKAYDADENYQLVYDDSTHASTKKNREALYAFFQKHLQNPGDAAEQDVKIYEYDKLLSTKSGQVSIEFDSNNAYDLNRRDLRVTMSDLGAKRRREDHVSFVQKAAAELAGVKQLSIQQNIFCGQFKRHHYFIEKHMLDKGDDFPLPFLVFRPNNSTEKYPVIFYLHPKGKLKDTGQGGTIEHLVKRGYMVIAADLIGMGERSASAYKGDSYSFKPGRISYNLWYLSEQIGSSIAGLQAAELSLLIDYLETRTDVDMQSVTGIAFKELCPTLQHCAVIDQRFSRMVLNQPLVSFASLAAAEYYNPRWIHSAVVGALTEYDLPDLLAAFAPKPLLVIDPLDHLARPLTEGLKVHGFRQANTLYEKYNLPENIVIHENNQKNGGIGYLYNWLEK